MRWLRRLFGASGGIDEGSHADCVDPACADRTAGAAAPQVSACATGDAAGAESEDACEVVGSCADEDDPSRPIDLGHSLDVGLASSSRVELESLADEVVALALHADRDERPLLSELARRLRQNELRLPPMPRAVVRVQRLLDSPQCSAQDIVREIELDPALTTRLVGIANSSFYRALDPVRSLGDAIVRIGLGETRNIVLAVMLRSRVFRVPGHELEVEQLWAHSVTTSICAETIGARVGEDPDAAFLTGLLHDLGRVVLLSLTGDVEGPSKRRARISAALVRRMDILLHAPLGATAAAAWEISPVIVQAIARHHDPQRALPEAVRMALVTSCADVLAHRILRTKPKKIVHDGWQSALQALDLCDRDGRELEEEAREALEARGKRL